MKKYNNIMGTFTGTIAKLEKLAVANNTRMEVKTEIIKKLKAEAVELDVELQAALGTAEKIKSFLEV